MAAACPSRVCPATRHPHLRILRHLRTDPDLAVYDHSWFVVAQKIAEKGFALSGSAQKPDSTTEVGAFASLFLLIARLAQSLAHGGELPSGPDVPRRGRPAPDGAGMRPSARPAGARIGGMTDVRGPAARP